MPDDKTKRHPLDGKRIDINDPFEITNWCEILKCTEKELKNAVEKVGTSSEKIKKYLN